MDMNDSKLLQVEIEEEEVVQVVRPEYSSDRENDDVYRILHRDDVGVDVLSLEQLKFNKASSRKESSLQYSCNITFVLCFGLILNLSFQTLSCNDNIYYSSYCNLIFGGFSLCLLFLSMHLSFYHIGCLQVINLLQEY